MMTSQQHARMLSIAHLAYGSVLLLFMSLIGMLSSVPDDRVNASVVIVFLIVAIGYPLPFLLTGYAIVVDKPWARAAAVISIVLSIMAFPVGTALAVYTIWYFFGGGEQKLRF
jgi:hypothetical protein